MRKLIIAQFLTLDGVSQAPGGPEEDTENEFKYGGWQIPYMGEDDGNVMAQIFDNMGAMLLGRKTYDIFADYWPHAGDGEQELIGEEDASIAKLMNGVPIYVASHADAIKEWDNETTKVTHLGADLATEINQIKQQDGKDIIVWGSGDLAQSLMEYGLVDEYFLMIYPLILGTGKKFFHDGFPKSELELKSSKTLSSGVFVGTYSTKK
ncbi:MAG: dihydrofolate reductase [Candidatus Saccharibacteria bacterium]|nr:dihydrofolate reductase [Candidatus Saccharibacteria bacterium]